MNNICFNLGLPCIFIKYNPDNKEVTPIKRHNTLLSRLKYYLDYASQVDESIKIEYLFYI
jgi:hypothetical protein